MAVRLTVVMVHCPPAGSGTALAEAVVGELIGMPGIDLTLVGALSGIDTSSTDHLSLSSISGDMAVLNWHGPQETQGQLAALGITAARSPHSHDRDALPPPSGTRRMYGYDLRQFSRVSELTSALSELKQRRQVSTFSIGIKTGGSRDSSTAISEPAATPRSTQGRSRSHQPTDGQPADQRTAARQDTDAAAQSPTTPTTAAIDLDDLLDQLDRADR